MDRHRGELPKCAFSNLMNVGCIACQVVKSCRCFYINVVTRAPPLGENMPLNSEERGGNELISLTGQDTLRARGEGSDM